MKIRFLLAKDLLNGGGIEKYTREVGCRLAARGHEVTVYSTVGKGQRPPSWGGMQIVWLPKAKPHWAEKFCGSFAAALRDLCSSPPDVVHLHSVAAGSMAALLKWRKAPCIVQMHGIEWQRSRWGLVGKAVLRLLESASIRCGDVVTAVSQVQCSFYAERYGILTKHIPTAADVNLPLEPKAILSLGLRPQKYVFCASRLVPEKGIHYLISAFRRAPSDWRLVVAGHASGNTEYSRRLHELAAGDDRIQFVGYVKGPLLNELFAHAAVYVQPSEVEGMAISLVEAMSYGTPCIVSDIPENQEAIGDAGICFKSKDAQDLARCLGWAAHNPDAMAAFGKRAQERVRALFSWDRVTDELESLYLRAIGRQVPSQHPGHLIGAPGQPEALEEQKAAFRAASSH